jgi:hypothetical protein
LEFADGMRCPVFGGNRAELSALGIGDEPFETFRIEVQQYIAAAVQLADEQFLVIQADLAGLVNAAWDAVGAQMIEDPLPIPMSLLPAQTVIAAGVSQLGISDEPRLLLNARINFTLQTIGVVQSLLKLARSAALSWFRPSTGQALAPFDHAILLWSARRVPMHVDA